MSTDKITVDEPLISTDVDKLIRTVADKRKVALNELQQLCKIDKKNLEKWVRVLEDEGYVTIEYGLRGTYILWNGDQESVAPTPTENSTAVRTTPAEAVSTVAEIKEDDTTPVEVYTQHFQEAAAVQEPEPEELLSQYLARRREAGENGNPDGIKISIIPDVDKSEKEVEQEDAADLKADREDESEAVAAEISADEPETPVSEAIADEKDEPEVFTVQRETVKMKKKTSDTRELVSAYIEEINREKAEIERLKKEKDRLYREKFASLEGKMEADVVALTEVILEKQTRIAELKERVLELPDKVDELEKLQEQMNALREEGRTALERTHDKVNQFIDSVESSKGNLTGKTNELRSTLEKERESITELEELEASVDERLGKLKTATDSVKSQIEELNQTMNSLVSDLEHAANMKVEVTTMTGALKETVSKHGEELSSLEAELGDISKVEQWVKEYISDYEKKMEDIEQYVAHSDDELAELKEAAESLYLKKYLGELHNMTEVYQSELDDALTKEKDIEKRISRSKERITDLIKESQDVIKRLRNEPTKNFNSVRSALREKTARIKGTIEEKEKERIRLIEDSRKTRKTTVTKSKNGKASYKPSKKKKK